MHEKIFKEVLGGLDHLTDVGSRAAEKVTPAPNRAMWLCSMIDETLYGAGAVR